MWPSKLSACSCNNVTELRSDHYSTLIAVFNSPTARLFISLIIRLHDEQLTGIVIERRPTNTIVSDGGDREP